MRIQFISGSEFPSEISHTLSKMRMCQALSDCGHKVLLTGIKSKILQDPILYYGLKGNFDIYLQEIKNIFGKKYSKKLFIDSIINGFFHRSHLLKFKPNIIYSRLTILELLFLPNDVPIIYEMHSLGPFGKNFIEKYLFKLILKIKNFKKIIVTTEVLANMLKKHIKGIEIVVARLSAEYPVNLTISEIQKFKHKNLKGKDFIKHVGYTGYLDNVGLRGTNIICKTAFKMPEVAFHIVGGKPEIVKYWENYAKQYNHNKNIFFYGFKNPSQIPFFLNCFDVVLAPLQFKPEPRAPIGANMSPLKLAQYMAYKKSMVVSDLTAHREILKDEKNAKFVKYDNVDEWKNAIDEILNFPEESKNLGNNAYEEYQKNYTPKVRVKKILEGFNE